MERISIKMVKDGSRTVIVIDGAPAERDRAAYAALMAYCGIEEPPTEIPQIPELEPVDDSDTVPLSDEELSGMEAYTEKQYGGVLISGGPYKGMTSAEALEKDKDRALFSLFRYAKKPLPESEKADVVKSCRAFMAELPKSQAQYAARDDKLRLISGSGEMLNIEGIITNYPNFTDFALRATDAEVCDVFNTVVTLLQSRGTNK